MAGEFFGILGDRGSHKTALMTYFAYNEYQKGRQIIANYKLEFPHTPMSFKQLAKLMSNRKYLPILERFRGAYFCFDELGVGADSYDFFQAQPRKITSLVAQIRKIEAEAIYTSQRLLMVAKRLREQTDGFFLMEDKDDKHPELVPDITIPHKAFTNCAGIAEVTVLDRAFNVQNEYDFDGTCVHHLYNSRQIIWSDDDED